MHQPGVDVRPLRHISGEVEFNEVFLDQARVPEFQRLGDVNDGWRVADATLSSERQMVAGAGFGWQRPGRRLGRRSAAEARAASAASPTIRTCASASRRCGARSASGPGPTSGWRRTSPPARPRARRRRSGRCTRPGSTSGCSSPRSTCSGLDALAWDVDGDVPEDSDAYYESLPFEVSGMLRSRANTIEGGTTEINKNVLGERVLGLPREPDAWLGKPWSEIPRS